MGQFRLTAGDRTPEKARLISDKVCPQEPPGGGDQGFSVSYEEQLRTWVALSALATCRQQILALPVLEGATRADLRHDPMVDRLVLMHEGRSR